MTKISRLFAVVSFVILKETKCNPVGRIIEDDVSDVKTKFLTHQPQSMEYDQVNSSNTALVIKSPNYLPSYKSKYSRGFNPDNVFPYPFFSNTPQEAYPTDRKFAWGDYVSEDADEEVQNNNRQAHSDAKYEVKEDKEDPDVPTYIEQDDRYHFGLYPRPIQNKHGFGFHHQHHGLGCFLTGNRRRPRPPLPPTTIATPSIAVAVPSIDPRVSTSAGIISSEAPSIDIRAGKDASSDQADRIVFPE